MTARGSGRTPPKGATAGPSTSAAWDYTLDATLAYSALMPANLGFGIKYGDAVPTDITSGTNLLGPDSALTLTAVQNFDQHDDPWKVHLAGNIGPSSAAVGHHVYLYIYDTTGGSTAPVIEHVDLGVAA